MSTRLFCSHRVSILSNLISILGPIVLLLANSGWAASTENVLYKFRGGKKDGGNPRTALVFDEAGNLYGTSEFGGINTAHCGPKPKIGCGTVFQLSPNPDGTWKETIVHFFASGSDGSLPAAGLVPDAAGSLYGTTGTTVFQLTPSGNGWTATTLHTFGGHDGSAPQDALVFDSHRNLYGTTYSGGSGEYSTGTAFQLVDGNGMWTENVLYSFLDGADGGYPSGAVAVDKEGNVYGTTAFGGINSSGVVFELTPSPSGWTETVLHEFSSAGPYDGVFPYAGVILDAQGNLYGTTALGGAYGYGTVYELTPSPNGWTETILYNFKGGTDGGNPNEGELIFDQAGNLYGMTSEGGGGNCARGYGCGTVYKLSPSGGWSETILYSFHGKPDGAMPLKGLVLGQNGHLYGTTYAGGEHACYGGKGCGIAFEIIP